MLHNLRPKVLGLQIPGIFHSAGATLIHRGDSWRFMVEAEHKAVCCLSPPQAFFPQRRRKRYVQRSDISTNDPDIVW